MKVNRIGEVAPYSPPNHHGCTALRLQGWDASDSKNFWVGLSHIDPDGGANYEATPLEKVYIVTSGEITVVTDDGEATLGPFDSCYIAANEAREVINRSDKVASLIVVIPYPAGTER